MIILIMLLILDLMLAVANYSYGTYEIAMLCSFGSGMALMSLVNIINKNIL